MEPDIKLSHIGYVYQLFCFIYILQSQCYAKLPPADPGKSFKPAALNSPMKNKERKSY